MINIDEFVFEKLDLAAVELLVQYANAEGWNPGPNDAKAFWETDPDGFYGYFKGGELIAGGSIVSYDGEYGFMGLFIVKPEYRSYGIGRKLWFQRRDTLISRLKSGASIGMDGVPDMQAFYKKGGFEIAFRDMRYKKIGMSFKVNPAISPFENSDLESILSLDKQCFGFQRQRFMRAWLAIPSIKTFKYVDHQGFRGFAIMRQIGGGHKICPLFADNKAIAKSLYEACLNAVPSEELCIDIPANNPMALELVQEYNASYVSECARMYYGEPPKVATAKVFGITTFELG